MTEPETRERDAVVVDCELEAPPEKVWRALTVPELAAEWLETELVEDGGNAASSRSCSVIEATPCTRIRYAWTDREASERDTIVTIELAPRPEGRTHFRLTHSAVAREPVMAANCNRPCTALCAA